jgi:hypothetical protein
MQSAHKAAKLTCPQCQFVNPRGKTCCKKCAADLSIQPQRPPLPAFLVSSRMSIPLRIIIPILAVVAFVTFVVIMLVRGPDHSLAASISRGDQLIAVEQASQAGYSRWTLSPPSSFLQAGTGSLIHDPATLIYETSLSHGAPFLDSETTKVALPPAEWQIMDAWRLRWCGNEEIGPAVVPSEQPYAVALRCGGYFGSDVLYVWRSQMPDEVLALLDRVAHMHP